MIFMPPAGLLPPETEIFEFFASFCDDFAVKNVDFSMQNAKCKYQIHKIFAWHTGFDMLLFYAPLFKKGNSKRGR